MGLFSTLLLGFTAGLRSMSAPAAASWTTRRDGIRWAGTPLAFLDRESTPFVLSALALGELIADKLPCIPDRTAPGPFIGRILSGAAAGAACNPDSPAPAAVVGAAAATCGTLAGSALRKRLASAYGSDLPAALTEDLIVCSLIALAFCTGLSRNAMDAQRNTLPGNSRENRQENAARS